jgi:predicted dehydrogenase
MLSNDRIGVGVIGCGRIGMSHIEAINELNDIAYLAAVIDENISIAEKVAEKYNTKFYGSTNEAFNDPSVQAVIVCLPNFLHTDVTINALKKDKHVLVEKPFTLSFKEAKQMVNQARKNDLVIMCAQSFRFIPELQEAQKRMLNEIGNPINMLYAFALHFDRKKAPPWWQYEEKTGGPVLMFLGPHIIDATLWFFEGKIPESVYAQGGSFKENFEGLDEATILIKFKDGTMATNYLSINTRPSMQECLITGEKGRIYFKHCDDPSEGRVGTFSVELSIGDKALSSKGIEKDNIKLENINFINSILKREKPFVKIEDTLLQMKIIEAAKKSMKTKKIVEIK